MKKSTRTIVYLVILCLLVFCASCSSESFLNIYIVDVGQGDSIVIMTADGQNVLIDSGPKSASKQLTDFIDSKKIKSFSYVYSTHPHEDHTGSMIDILKKYKVGNIIDPGYAHTSATFERYLTMIDELNIPFKTVRAKDIFMIGKDVSIKVLWPYDIKENEKDVNEISLVLLLKYKNFSMLLTGDIGSATENVLISKGMLEDINVLKVAHHGSKGSTSQKFLDIVKPEISVICVGAKNSYNHPTDVVLRRLQLISKIYRTDLNGNINIKTDGRNTSVLTEK